MLSVESGCRSMLSVESGCRSIIYAWFGLDFMIRIIYRKLVTQGISIMSCLGAIHNIFDLFFSILESVIFMDIGLRFPQ